MITVAGLFGTAQVWAQGAGTAKPSALPPPTPAQAGRNNPSPAQPTGNNNLNDNLRPPGMSPQEPAAQGSQQAAQPALTAPQPPTESGAGGQGPNEPATPQLGVYVVPTDGAGVRVGNVTDGTAAAAAGLQPGDILLTINGKFVDQPQDVIDMIHRMKPGDRVELRIWRNGGESSLTATLQPMQLAPESEEFSGPQNGYIEDVARRNYYGRGPIVRRYYGSYPSFSYSYPYTYSYPYYGYYGSYGFGYPYGAYYGTPRYGYYYSPWRQGVRIGPFGFSWR